MKWEMVKISEVTVNLDNRRKPLNEGERSKISKEKLYPYIGANNIMGYVDEYLFDEEIICVAEDGGSWGANEKCASYVQEKCWVNNHAHVLGANEKADLKFLMYYLNLTDLNRYITGSTRGKLTKTALDSIKIPLPPLATQKRIAAILDAADALRRKDQALLQKYDELAQAIFVDMFGDPVKNEKGFESTKLEKVLAEGKNKIRSGPFGSDLLHSEFVSEGISVLGIDNVVNNRFEVGKERYITPEKFKSLSRYQVFPDDVLITIMGTTGRSAVVPKGIGTAINTKHLVAITPNKEIIDSIFLSYSLTKDPGIIAQIKRKSRGAIMEGLNMGIIKDLNFNLPPISLQKKFVESISKIDSMKEKITASSSETLFQSLLQKAFNAELVP